MKTFDISDFGAVADGHTMNTRAIQSAVLACRDAGGGILRVPPGTFLTGTFEIFSDTTLLVEKDGRLLASPVLADHVVEEASVGLLFSQDAKNVVLTGEGTLDGNGLGFFHQNLLHASHRDYLGHATWQRRRGLPFGSETLEHGPFLPNNRPGNMLVFARCTNLRIENLLITGAAYWTLHCADCEDVIIEKLRIDNDLRIPNNDGIHLTTCRRAKIRNCWISCGDDSIALTGFREHAGETGIAFGLTGLPGTCEDIEIADCTLISRSAGVRIGYGHNPVRNVRISRLDIRESNRGIGIFARQADVEDIVVEDCRIQTGLVHGNWWGRGEPIQLSAVRFAGESRLFSIRNVTFRDIEAVGENAVTLFAEEPGAISGVKMIRVRSVLKRGPLFETWGGNLDLRPMANDQAAMVEGGTAPLWVIGVPDLQCEDCEWSLADEADSPFSSEVVIRESP
jgi:polygalacturonase